MASSVRRNERRALKALMPTIRQDVDEAVDFIGEFAEDFEKADKYYNGLVDLEAEENRSKVVATQVRDSIRNMRPSIMRTLCSNRHKIVNYTPTNIQVAKVVGQQTAYVHQLFWENNGYITLFNAVDESLRHKFGPVKTYWEEFPTPKFQKFTMLTREEVEVAQKTPGIKVLGIEIASPPVGMDVEVFNVEVLVEKSNGRIVMQAVPYGEFFISRNATGPHDALVHGHRRSVTVAEAKALGLEYKDWKKLDDLDPQADEVPGPVNEKRGFSRDRSDVRPDELSHRFLLTEAYVFCDLHGVGYPQLWCLYLGGTKYELLDHERETESPFDLIRHDLMSFSPIGYSVADIAADSQDVLTSMLRGMVDNIHAGNNPRIGANPSQVNFDDLLNHSIGHPVRFKGNGAQVQVIQVPTQIQAALPMLQWLENDAQSKIGVTKAAQGLDPNAMQSTDKDAVKNTLMLAQGQVELAVRNIIETGVIGIFKKLLRLSIQHKDRVQIVRTQGSFLPVDQLMFDPDLYAEPNVGLGTASEEMRMMGLQATLASQMQLISTLGMNNPFASASHVYNTLEDITRGYGLHDVGRYYNFVDPAVEAEFAEKKRAELLEAEKNGKPIDPGQALVHVEQIKAETARVIRLMDARTDALRLKLDALTANAKDDLERDKLAQDLVVSIGQILAKTGTAIDTNALKREQAAERTPANTIGAMPLGQSPTVGAPQ
jgi:hypothetical protein